MKQEMVVEDEDEVHDTSDQHENRMCTENGPYNMYSRARVRDGRSRMDEVTRLQEWTHQFKMMSGNSKYRHQYCKLQAGTDLKD